MKKIIVPISAALFCCFSEALFAGNTLPDESISCEVFRHYKYRPDKQAGREVRISYNGAKSLKNAYIEIVSDNKAERTSLKGANPESIQVLLPAGIGANKDDTVQVNLALNPKDVISKEIIIPYARQWTVYIYPHSHVDIGYTNTQANVEIIHKRNLEYAIELAEKTKDYPEDARFVWNPEVTWPIERYLKTESKEKCDKLIQAINNGQIAVDAGYVNTNTSSACDEELFEFFDYSKRLEKLTGKQVKTMVQIDIPGVSWGVVPVAAQLKIPYCLTFNNGGDRIGLSTELNFQPFWWLGPDGKSKILYLQPGAYGPGAHNKGWMFWPGMSGQLDPDKILRIVKTDNPRDNFIDPYINEMLPKLEKADYYPYDIFPMSWCMADNTPIDYDLPEAVKSWNEEFAYPHLKICSATEIMSTFEERYGDQIPTRSGDFTEYWTDGLGSQAKFTGRHREVKENLIQTETLWSMLKPETAAPRDEIEETWRNILLGTEHTWTYRIPEEQPIADMLLNTKLGYFHTSDSLQQDLQKKTLEGIAETESAFISVFNTSSWVRSEVVKLSKEISGKYKSVIEVETGKEVISQRLTTGELAFLAENVDALSAKKYRLSTKPAKKRAAAKIEDNTLDNGLVRVKVCETTGDVVSLVYNGEEFVDGKSMSAINSYRYLHGEDEGILASKAYNVKVSVKENGPLVNSLLIESDAEGCNSLSREVSVVAGQSYVSFYNVVDKIAITDKEGIHFGFAFDINDPVLRADLPWGVMEVEKNQLAEGNRNWITMQRWLNISNNDKNVTWCSLNSCMFEVGEMSANILGGAFESPKWIREIKPSSTIYSWALNNHWHTNFPLSQEGIIKFEYRILPAKGAYNAADANRFGMEQIRPMIAVLVNRHFAYEPNMKLNGDKSVVVSMVKTVDEGKSQLVRLRSVSDKEEIVSLDWAIRKPRKMSLYQIDGGGECMLRTDESFKVPAMGFVTLRIDW